MKRTTIIILVLTFLMLLLSAVLFFGNRKYHSDINDANIALYKAQTEIKQYQIDVDGLRETVFETHLLLIDSDKKIFDLEEEGARLKELDVRRVKLIGELNAEIKILKDSIPPSDTVIIIQEPDGNYMKIPQSYEYSDKWATLSAQINDMGNASLSAKIDSIDFNVVLGDRGGLFKKKEDVAILTTTCPYVDVTGQKFLVVSNEKSPWRYVATGSVVTLVAIGILKAVL